jgi:carbonic anhydrase
MNISPDIISGDCKLKCAYSFNYPISNCVATNKKYYISLTYDTTSIPAVKFNNDNYNVSKIHIFSPSIHLFNGSKLDGEFIIEHTPLAGGSNLFVCIPIISDGSSSTDLQNIISTVSNQAPAQGESTNINLSNFTLNSIVPMKSFYSYSVGNKAHFIVYDRKNAISINSESMKTLQSLITSTNDESSVINSIFLTTTDPTTGQPILVSINTDGPRNEDTIGDGQIYIDCRPTGNSEESTDITYVKPAITMDFTINSIMQNPVLLFIVSSIFAILFLYIMYYAITYLSNGKANFRLPQISKNNS